MRAVNSNLDAEAPNTNAAVETYCKCVFDTKKDRTICCGFLFYAIPFRLRTVDSNLDVEAPLTSDGVGTYSERANGAKKGHGKNRVLFVLRQI
jgi:hypothetical protein